MLACLWLCFPGFFVNFPTCAFTNNFVYANGHKPQRGALDLCEFRTSALSVKYCKSNLIKSKRAISLMIPMPPKTFYPERSHWSNVLLAKNSIQWHSSRSEPSWQEILQENYVWPTIAFKDNFLAPSFQSPTGTRLSCPGLRTKSSQW